MDAREATGRSLLNAIQVDCSAFVIAQAHWPGRPPDNFYGGLP